jgi:predicted nucleic acid-binding protein
LALVLDTGPIVALLDAADPEHERCVAMVADVARISSSRRPAAPIAFTISTKTGSRGQPRSNARTSRSISGFVDAAVMVTCERLGETKVATLDRRDFDVVPPRHCKSLTLLPE